MKFNVGDKVKIIRNDGGPWYNKYIGTTARVVDVNIDDEYKLDTPNTDGGKTEWWDEDELEKFKNKCKDVDSKLFQL